MHRVVDATTGKFVHPQILGVRSNGSLRAVPAMTPDRSHQLMCRRVFVIMRVVVRMYTAALASIGTLVFQSALAHHSTAEFDYSKTVTISGTVKEVQWTNPHSFIQLLVPGKGKEPVEWAVEIGSPSINISLGWKKTSVKAGDVVTMIISPARNGSPLGTLRTLTFQDGRELQGVAARVRPVTPPPPAQGK
jgi:hypothetical protein